MSSDSSARHSLRLPSLDGWRAVAIALVLLSHFTAARGFPTPLWWDRVFQGNLGVRIFFVISGLLITYLLLLEADRRGRPSLRSFYTRRVLRIFPVYFLYLTVVFALTLAGLYTETVTAWIGSLTYTRNFIGAPQSLTGHYWSLSVEEQFYVLWPVLLVTLRLWRHPRIAIGLLLIPIVLGSIVRANVVLDYWNRPWIDRAQNLYSTFRYADSLAVGCLGAFAYRKYGDRLVARLPRSALAMTLLIVAVAAAAPGYVGNAEAAIPLVQAIAIVCAIYITIGRRSGLMFRLLNQPLVIWLGVLSYSLYVWQELFIAWSAGPRLSTLAVYDWRIWWIAAFGCACASYYLVERPILRIRDKYRRVPVAEPAQHA